jgi:hypothetical protein
MSTSMLEQAVIDAEALREAAVKNAEQTILEKYSSEIGEAVASLLEQPEDELMGDEEQQDREDVVDEMPLAATADEELCPCPDDKEKVTIDLDKLEVMMAKEDELDMDPQNLQEMYMSDEDVDDLSDQELEAEEEEKEKAVERYIKRNPGASREQAEAAIVLEMSSMAGGAVEGAAAVSLEDDEELMEVNDEDLMEAISGMLSEKKAKKDYDGDGEVESSEEEWKGSRDKAIKKAMNEEELDISEEQLGDILEALTVDLENVPSGMLFHNHPTESEDERSLDVALAKEQDTAYAEEQKELRDAIKKLQEQVKSQKLRLNKQKKDYDNLKSIAIKATKKLEEVNFSNAKLIYTNRVLKSDSLNERQKDKLVEALSKVDSVEEAKIVFDTLNENLSSKSEKAPKTLNEAVSKNNPLILKSNKEKQPANSSQVDRMKKLAGII